MINKEHQEYNISILRAQLATQIYSFGVKSESVETAVEKANEILKEAGVLKAYDNLKKFINKK